MTIVVLGAGYAGVTAAVRLAKRSRERTRVTLVNASPYFVERIRLHETASGHAPAAIPLQELVAGTGVELALGMVEKIDLGAQKLQLAGRALSWDRLVLCLGSQTDVAVPGVREHAYTLDASSAERLAKRLPELAARSGRLVVVGGGLTGIEAASELAEAWPGLHVTLVTRGALASEFSPRGQAHVRAHFARAGITVIEQATIRALQETRLQSDRGALPFDVCVWSAGFRAPSIVAEAGFEVNERGQVRVDEYLRSRSHPDVFVAGDLASMDPACGVYLPMGCKSALPTAAHAAKNLARALEGKSPLPLKYHAPGFCMSLGRRDAVAAMCTSENVPSGRAVLGRPAAVVKEFICSATVWALRLQRGSAPRYTATEPRADAVHS